MATSSRHSLPTQPKGREEKRAWLYNNQFQNRRQKQLTKVRTRGVTVLEWSEQNNLPLGVELHFVVTEIFIFKFFSDDSAMTTEDGP
jgi:hypothetical protein